MTGDSGVLNKAVTAPPSGTGLTAVLDSAVARLQTAGVTGARRDARILAAQALGVDPEQIVLDRHRRLTVPEVVDIEALVERRCKREPVSRIRGFREFWSLPFKITADTLDPRPDSETLIQAVLDHLPECNATLNILDLGTGSGCLLLALLSELPQARGLGIDVSDAALAVARGNAQALGLSGRAGFDQGNWGRNLAGSQSDSGPESGLESGLDSGPWARSWDVIICNPPYIATDARAELAPEVADFDPPAALFAGPDGLRAYRAIAADIRRLLAPEGLAALELGAGQAMQVEALMRAAHLRLLGRKKDLGGVERCLLATAAGNSEIGVKK